MIAILQPLIPHYRKAFFEGLKTILNVDLYCYENTKKSVNFKITNIKEKYITNIAIGPFLVYNPFALLSKKYSQLVLMLHFGHITTWILLLTKFIHNKKIVLWGQGISVKRYLKEEENPNILLKWMVAMADVIWFYTEKEKQQWQKIFPNKKMVALNNTISGIEDIVAYKSIKTKEELKQEYNLPHQIYFIFCARFNNHHRRQDLLLETIEKLDSKKFGFIIIGEGPAKPNFSKFNNVYDYGAVYNIEKKQDLFTIADLYIQPGWVGLSIVEAMGYGKPIVTFKRSKEVLQCVEYYYLKNNKNAFIFESIEQLMLKIEKLSIDQIKEMEKNARDYVSKGLNMKHMIEIAALTLKK